MDKHTLRFFFLITALLLPGLAHAFSPVARFDMVPMERIEYGGSLKVGVIAFSKPGIAGVAFSATGQGYSGGTKTVTAMTLNTTTNVWEYWTIFPASEFTGNGAITITAVVTDNSSNTRNLSMSAIVEGASAYTHHYAYVNGTTGNDSTCTADSAVKKCQTIATAISKAQTANFGSSSGNIIYLENGTYSLGSGSVSTATEWLTLQAAPGATRASTIINAYGSVANTTYLKTKGITLQSQGYNQLVFDNPTPTNLWVDDCALVGAGRYTLISSPVGYNDGNMYVTSSTLTAADYGFKYIPMVRNTTITGLGNDALSNTQLVVNVTASDLTNGTTGWHTDAYQVHTTGVPPANNRIIYNYKATDVHVEGIFARSDAGQATDNAFVNVMVEMRDPASPNESGEYAFGALEMYHSWDHFLMWHCTLPYSASSGADTMTNSSFVGNVFWQFRDMSTTIGNPVVSWAAPSNAGNNEFTYNHFMHVYGVTSACTPTSSDAAKSHPCPHWYAKRPDSGSPATSSVGSGVLDMSNPAAVTYCAPLVGSSIINRLPSVRVPADLFGNARDATPDLGAIEYDSGDPVRSAGAPSSNIAFASTATISLTTNVAATCKYGTAAGVAYASMANTFGTSGGTSHSQSGVAVSAGTNTFYVRCDDGTHVSPTDYVISFNVLANTQATIHMGTGGTMTMGGSGTITLQ